MFWYTLNLVHSELTFYYICAQYSLLLNIRSQTIMLLTCLTLLGNLYKVDPVTSSVQLLSIPNNCCLWKHYLTGPACKPLNTVKFMKLCFLSLSLSPSLRIIMYSKTTYRFKASIKHLFWCIFVFSMLWFKPPEKTPSLLNNKLKKKIYWYMFSRPLSSYPCPLFDYPLPISPKHVHCCNL